MLRAIAGEGLCTYLFLFIVEAISVNMTISSKGTLLVSAVSTALTGLGIIYSFADVSGAHFNPSVTFATIIGRKMNIRKGDLPVFDFSR
jgi:glycerol uptake facilitator-like aquaporin